MSNTKKRNDLTLELDEGSYQIEWDEFKVGASVFIPCTNLMEAKSKMRGLAKRRNIQVTCVTVIERKMLGIRCWRIL